MSAPWITYRPELKSSTAPSATAACATTTASRTLRQGVYDPASRGIDYMELGYKSSKRIFARNKFGDWKFATIRPAADRGHNPRR